MRLKYVNKPINGYVSNSIECKNITNSLLFHCIDYYTTDYGAIAIGEFQNIRKIKFKIVVDFAPYTYTIVRAR